MATIAPTHPGEVLFEEFLVPLEVTQHRLAVSIGGPSTNPGAVQFAERTFVRLRRATRRSRSTTQVDRLRRLMSRKVARAATD